MRFNFLILTFALLALLLLTLFEGADCNYDAVRRRKSFNHVRHGHHLRKQGHGHESVDKKTYHTDLNAIDARPPKKL